MSSSEGVMARPLNWEDLPLPCLTEPEHHQASQLLNTTLHLTCY